MTAVNIKNKKDKKEFPILVYPEKCTGCRMCQMRCSIRNLDEFNPFKSYITIVRDHGKRTLSLNFANECTWCGYCARFCSYGALVLRKSVEIENGERKVG
jgi:carbon-monoxide dehydrogenase iron sulfur subunit